MGGLGGCFPFCGVGRCPTGRCLLGELHGSARLLSAIYFFFLDESGFIKPLRKHEKKLPSHCE